MVLIVNYSCGFLSRRNKEGFEFINAFLVGLD